MRVPAASGGALQVPKGATFRVTTPSAQQVGDLFVFNRDDVGEYLSAGHTRLALGRLFPVVGETFHSNRRRPIASLVEDGSACSHDMLIPACDRERYRQLGAGDDHPNCSDNLRLAMRELGHEIVDVPQPVNVFMPVPVAADATLSLDASPAAPGDTVAFRAEQEVVVVLTACAQDLTDLNGGVLTDLALEID